MRCEMWLGRDGKPVHTAPPRNLQIGAPKFFFANTHTHTPLLAGPPRTSPIGQTSFRQGSIIDTARVISMDAMRHPTVEPIIVPCFATLFLIVRDKSIRCISSRDLCERFSSPPHKRLRGHLFHPTPGIASRKVTKKVTEHSIAQRRHCVPRSVSSSVLRPPQRLRYAHFYTRCRVVRAAISHRRIGRRLRLRAAVAPPQLR